MPTLLAGSLLSQKLGEVALQILDGLKLNLTGEQGELDREQKIEKRELDWLQAHNLR